MPDDTAAYVLREITKANKDVPWPAVYREDDDSFGGAWAIPATRLHFGTGNGDAHVAVDALGMFTGKHPDGHEIVTTTLRAVVDELAEYDQREYGDDEE